MNNTVFFVTPAQRIGVAIQGDKVIVTETRLRQFADKMVKLFDVGDSFPVLERGHHKAVDRPAGHDPADSVSHNWVRIQYQSYPISEECGGGFRMDDAWVTAR